MSKRGLDSKVFYRYGRQVILKYKVGKTEILESPSVEFADQQTTFTRSLEIGQRDKELVVQVAKLSPEQAKKIRSIAGQLLLTNAPQPLRSETVKSRFDGSGFFESKKLLT